MELLLLLLLVPIGWLVLLPSRIAKGARRYRMTTASILLGAVAAAWVGAMVFSGPPHQNVDYAASDDTVRAILMHPEVAPRYSSRN